MKKRLLPVLFMLFFLSGCGEKREEPLQVALCWCDARDGAGLQLRQAVEAAAGAQGWSVIGYDARGDQSRQDSQLLALPGSVDLVILEPVMPNAMEQWITAFSRADVPVVFVNRQPPEQLLQSRRCAYVGADPMEAGRLQGKIISDLPDGGDRNGDGKVRYLVIQGPEDHLTAQSTTEGCMLALGEKADNLAVASGNWTKESGYRLCAKALSKFKETVEVIFCGSDAMALGALEAAREAGRDDLYLVGLGGQPEAEKLTGTVRFDTDAFGEDVITTCRSILSGEDPGVVISRCYGIVKKDHR